MDTVRVDFSIIKRDGSNNTPEISSPVTAAAKKRAVATSQLTAS